jgi:hypothetical protein
MKCQPDRHFAIFITPTWMYVYSAQILRLACQPANPWKRAAPEYLPVVQVTKITGDALVRASSVQPISVAFARRAAGELTRPRAVDVIGHVTSVGRHESSAPNKMQPPKSKPRMAITKNEHCEVTFTIST